jgi:hypothetical protein
MLLMDSVHHDEIGVAVLVTASNRARVRRHARALPLTNEKAGVESRGSI